MVCGEGIAVGESTLVACGTIVDIKLRVGLEVSAEATLTDSVVVNMIGTPATELAAAWGPLTLTVDMTSGSGTPEVIIPCADLVVGIPGVDTVSIVVGTTAKGWELPPPTAGGGWPFAPIKGVENDPTGH